MADDANAAALAERDQQIADLKAQLAAAGGSPAVSEPEDLTPYPTQAQLDDLKLGRSIEPEKAASYKTRAVKAG